jgi:signal peptidase I
LSNPNKFWKNDYFKTVVAIILIVAIVLGFLFGLQFALHTAYPALTVESGSMSIPYDGADNFWLSIAHPFQRTLSIGDIIIVQGINPKNLNTNYPNSNIIVFHSPDNYNTLIVHRIIGTDVVNGTTYYLTKGDGNGNPWPQTPTSGFDPWDYNNSPGVPASYIVGIVVMRIPWFGWVTLFMRDNSWGLPVVIAIIMLLIIIEFIIPILREKKPQQQNGMQPQSQVSL